MYQISFHSLLYFQIYAPDNLFIAKIKKGHNSVNIAREVTVYVFCTSSDHVLLLYQVSRKYLQRLTSYGADTISILIITKGHNSVHIASGVTAFVLCTPSNQDLHLYLVMRKYSERFPSYGADTISILIITKRHNFVDIAHGVTVLVLCTSSDHGLHLYQVSRKYLERF